MDKHKLGQYFTTNIELKNVVKQFILNDPDIILEPSCGRGDLISHIDNARFDAYEIDDSIEFLPEIEKDSITIGDFLLADIKKKYKTIIGNPPYVKTSSGNLYLDFTNKCIDLLEEKGELIFIVPSDFLKLSSASKLLNKMTEEGTFTHIHHPHNERLFEGASIDVIVYRYVKDKTLEKKVYYNGKSLYVINTNGIITFSDIDSKDNIRIGDIFSVYVGMVSGKEEVFKNEVYGNMKVRNGKDKMETYICVEKFPTGNEELDKYLLSYKNDLKSRGIRSFNESNWFEWGALRNKKTVEENMGSECIYISTLSRKQEIAFKGKVEYTGGSLLLLIPKKDVNLDLYTEYFNSDSFKKNFLFSGRFKIGHKQLSNSLIPSNII
jgi:adenine-specific DNA-methyltransferase